MRAIITFTTSDGREQTLETAFPDTIRRNRGVIVRASKAYLKQLNTTLPGWLYKMEPELKDVKITPPYHIKRQKAKP